LEKEKRTLGHPSIVKAGRAQKNLSTLQKRCPTVPGPVEGSGGAEKKKIRQTYSQGGGGVKRPRNELRKRGGGTKGVKATLEKRRPQPKDLLKTGLRVYKQGAKDQKTQKKRRGKKGDKSPSLRVGKNHRPNKKPMRGGRRGTASELVKTKRTRGIGVNRRSNHEA